MFGQNPIRSPERNPSILALEKAFYTIQGEGPQGGRPALFVRLAGCNLACYFCDTQFETQAENPRPVTEIVEELLRRFSPEQRRLVVLTGGEPLRQEGIRLLIATLLVEGTQLVQIETAGTLWVPGLASYIEAGLVQLVCSPKTPRVRLDVLTLCRHWKYIVRAGELSSIDGLPRRGTQLATKDKLSELFRPRWVRDLEPPEGTVWLSPMDEGDPEKNKANMEAAVRSCLDFGYRLSLQVHKIIGVE